MNAQVENRMDGKKRCVQCYEAIQAEAMLCPYCRSRQEKGAWARIAVFLKWIGGITAVTSLVLGVIQFNSVLVGWKEKRAAVSQLIRASNLRYRVGDLDGAWLVIKQALDLDPANEDARRLQVEQAMRWAREMICTPANNKMVEEEIYPVLYRGAADYQASSAADVMAHIVLLDYECRGHSEKNIRIMREQLDKALTIDKGNVYAHALMGYQMVLFDHSKDEAIVDRAMHHFSMALKDNRDNQFVRSYQYATLFSCKRYGKVLQLADENRKNGEALPRGQCLRVLALYKNLWEFKDEKTIFDSLAPDDLLKTFQWLESCSGSPGPDLEWQFVRIRLMENTGDASGAARSYEELAGRVNKEIASDDYWKEFMQKIKRRLKPGGAQ